MVKTCPAKDNHKSIPASEGPLSAEFPKGGLYGYIHRFENSGFQSADGDWSMNFWIKPEEAIEENSFLAGFGRTNLYRPPICHWIQGLDGLRFKADDVEFGTAHNLEEGKWQMLTAVYANGTLTIYKDSILLASQPAKLGNKANEIQLAMPTTLDGQKRRKGEARFHGKIALFTLFNSALAVEDIQKLQAASDHLDSLAFSKGAPATWPLLEREFHHPDPQLVEALPKSLATPQKPRVTKLPTTQKIVKNDDRRFTLAGSWKLIQASKVKENAAQISQPGFDTEDWLAATVPGTVLMTMVNQGVYPHPYYGLNNLEIPETLARQDYWYRIEFEAPQESVDLESFLKFNGINYAAEVWLNGESLGSMKGAFIRGTFKTTGILKPVGKNVLAVRISPTPNPGISHEQSIAAGAGHNGGNMVGDGPTFFCSEGWDWIPGIRDRNTGIWQNVELHLTGDVKFGDPQVITRIPQPVGSLAEVSIAVELQNQSRLEKTGILIASFEGVNIEKKVTIPPNSSTRVHLAKEEFPELAVKSPRLWWPNGYGKPDLYNLALLFKENDGTVSDSKKIRFGMRETSVVLSAMDSKQKVGRYEFNPTESRGEMVIKNDHASLVDSVQGWVPSIADEKGTLPGLKESNSTETAPYLELRVNGQRIPMRGGNWGMDDGMKNISRERLEPYIRLQRDANFNILRVWCGQSMSKDLYDLCDEYGIMVYNEFWLTTMGHNLPPTDSELLLKNAEDAIKRFRNHPSIVLWCGRNEGVPPPKIQQGLDELIRKHDGTRYYIPCSWRINITPSGPWRYTSLEFFYQQVGFSTELGLPSPLTADSIRSMLAPEDLWPPNDVWAYHDWIPSSAMDVRTYTNAIEQQYGEPADFEDFVKKAQLMNYVSHRAMYEGMNSHLWNPTTGRFLWMSHPSWPSMVWQIYGWDYQPNASFYGIKKACEPVHIQFNLTDRLVLAINTTNTAIPQAKATAKVYDLNFNLLSTKDVVSDLLVNGKTEVFRLDALPQAGVHFIHLELVDSKGKLLSDNLYWRAEKPEDLKELTTLPKVKLQTKVSRFKNKPYSGVKLELENTSKIPALMAFITLRNPQTRERILPAYIDENYVSLLPGQKEEVTIETPIQGSGANEIPLLVTLEGWNLEEQDINIP